MTFTTSSRRRFIARASAATVAAAAGFGTPLLARAETVLKMNLPVGQTDVMSAACLKFGEIVAQKTNGAIKVQLFYNGTLGRQAASITGMQNGVLDLTNQTTAWLEPLVPKIEALDLPFLFSNAASAERVLDGEIGRQLSSELADKGIVVLAWTTNGWRDMELVSTKVTKPADMAGLKIRVQSGPVYVAMMKALNAIPVVLDVSELYLALQQKLANGLEVPIGTMLSLKLDEVVKYIALTHHLYNPAPIMMSKVKFDSLPADQRTALVAAGRETLPIWRQQYAQAYNEAVATAKSKGIAVEEVDHPAFRKAMDPVYAQFKEQIGASFVDQLIKAAS